MTCRFCTALLHDLLLMQKQQLKLPPCCTALPARHASCTALCARWSAAGRSAACDIDALTAGDSIAVLDRGGKPEKLTAASDHKVTP